jgi:hypothetical protein
MTKDAVIIVLTVGFPMFFKAVAAKDGRVLMAKQIRDLLGVTAILAFYVNLVSLPLVGELVLQPALIFLALISAVAKHQKGDALKVAKAADVLLGLAGVALLTYTTVRMVQQWHQLDLRELVLTAAMSFWLPPLILPFIYVLAFYGASEMVLTMLRFFNDRKQPAIGVRLGVLLGFRGSVRYAANFNGHWRADVARLRNLRSTLEVMRAYRHSPEIEAAKPDTRGGSTSGSGDSLTQK